MSEDQEEPQISGYIGEDEVELEMGECDYCDPGENKVPEPELTELPNGLKICDAHISRERAGKIAAEEARRARESD